MSPSMDGDQAKSATMNIVLEDVVASPVDEAVEVAFAPEPPPPPPPLMSPLADVALPLAPDAMGAPVLWSGEVGDEADSPKLDCEFMDCSCFCVDVLAVDDG